PQPGLVVFETEARAMEPRNRRDETQAETTAIGPAALADSHERLYRAHAVIGRHTRTIVAHDETNTIRQALHAQIDPAARRNILQTVLDEIRDELGEQLASPWHDGAALCLVDENEARLAYPRLDQLGEPGGELADIDRRVVRAGG